MTTLTRTLSIVCAAACAFGAAPAALALPEPQGLVSRLTPDMTVRLTLIDRLKSGAARRGDTVRFHVDEDVVDSAGNVLIRKGTPAFGQVSGTSKNGIFGKRGTLQVSVDWTSTVDNQRVELAANHAAGGRSATNGALGLAVAATPLGLLMRGGNASIDAGTVVVARVNTTLPVRITPPAPQVVVAQHAVVASNGVVTAAVATHPAAPVPIYNQPGSPASAVVLTQPAAPAGAALVVSSPAAAPVVVGAALQPTAVVVNPGAPSGTVVALPGTGAPETVTLPVLHVLFLRNGDRVTGSIQGLTGGTYTVVTRIGVMKIGAAEVFKIVDAEVLEQSTKPAPAASSVAPVAKKPVSRTPVRRARR